MKKGEKLNETIIDQRCVLCGNRLFSLVLKIRDEIKGKEFKLIKCTNCGLAHILPIPRNLEELYSDEEYYAYNDLEKSESGTLYDRLLGSIGHYSISRTFDENRCGIENLIKEFAFKLVSHRFSGHRRLFWEKNGKPKKILDIGTGGGMFLDVMRSLGWKTYGVDISAIAVRKLKKRGFNAFHGELEQANFACNYFDVVRASFVIEHVRNPLTFLQEICRILKPRGSAIICLPNFGSFQSKFFQENWNMLSIPQHIYHFNNYCLEGLINKAGFKLMFRRLYSGGSFIPSLQNRAKNKGANPVFLKFINNHFFTLVSLVIERFLVTNPFFCDAMEVYVEKR